MFGYLNRLHFPFRARDIRSHFRLSMYMDSEDCSQGNSHVSLQDPDVADINPVGKQAGFCSLSWCCVCCKAIGDSHV